MARGPSAKNTREGKRTYPCGSIPLLPAIVLPRLAPLLMISPSNRKSDDTSIDHLFCLCTIGRRLSTSARGAGFACRCCRRVGYFGPISGESAGVAEFVPDDFHTHPYRRYRATVSDSGRDSFADGRRRRRHCFTLAEPASAHFGAVPQQAKRAGRWHNRQPPSVFENVRIGDDSDVGTIIRVDVNVIQGARTPPPRGEEGWLASESPTISASSTVALGFAGKCVGGWSLSAPDCARLGHFSVRPEPRPATGNSSRCARSRRGGPARAPKTAAPRGRCSTAPAYTACDGCESVGPSIGVRRRARASRRRPGRCAVHDHPRPAARRRFRCR